MCSYGSACTHAFMYVFMYACIHACICMHASLHPCILVLGCMLCDWTCICACVRACVHARTRALLEHAVRRSRHRAHLGPGSVCRVFCLLFASGVSFSFFLNMQYGDRDIMLIWAPGVSAVFLLLFASGVSLFFCCCWPRLCLCFFLLPDHAVRRGRYLAQRGPWVDYQRGHLLRRARRLRLQRYRHSRRWPYVHLVTLEPKWIRGFGVQG